MRSTFWHPVDYLRPKRGDLVQTNVGNWRERTFIVLSVRSLGARPRPEMGLNTQRTRVWAERWWEIEPATRVALARSAERAGGQAVHYFEPFRAKKNRTFEEHMQRSVV